MTRTEFLLAMIGTHCVGVGTGLALSVPVLPERRRLFSHPVLRSTTISRCAGLHARTGAGPKVSAGATHGYLRFHKRLAGVGIAGTGMAFATLVYYQTILVVFRLCVSLLPNPLPWKKHGR